MEPSRYRDAEYFERTTVVITGGASGIGEATARSFHSAGAHVVLFDLDEARLNAVSSDLGSLVTAVNGNVAKWEDYAALQDAVRDTGRPLKAVVNSAASFLAKGSDATAADWDHCLGTNVKGSALVTAALLEELRQAGGAAVVNIASISGYIAQRNRWTYNATKGAILALTRCQALDLAEFDIRVNSVSPGTIWTPELDRMTGSDRARWAPIFGSQHMLNRVGEASEVAEVILFLCGPGASFITGADILVDGGYVAMGHEQLGPPVPYSDS